MNKAKQWLVWLAIAMCAGTITACAPTDERRAPGEFVDDAALTARVKTALANAKGINANAINVNSYRGEVVLSGFLESQDMIARAGEIARKTGGVRAVRNDLHVSPKR
ncbi:MAG TPA: BON domain-containing protein [Burkholderiales bacterium]|nr:BON domain-containing protein [Burkholderiales bacterium]